MRLMRRLLCLIVGHDMKFVTSYTAVCRRSCGYFYDMRKDV